MKPIIADPEQLDELAAGLDAGWDAEPSEPSHSEPPYSSPLPEALARLDADWDVAPREPTAAARQARAVQPRKGPDRNIAPTTNGGRSPLFVSKQERREADRKRRAHQNQQTSEHKKQRKVERQAEARRAAEQQRLAEQQAIAERRARQAQKRAAASPEPSATATAQKRITKRAPANRAASMASPALPQEPKALKTSPPVVVERGAKRLILPLLIAILVAVTLGFALSRAR
jgi:hypothetical protein